MPAAKPLGDLGAIIEGLSLAYRLYETARPAVVEIASLLSAAHPGHARRIEQIFAEPSATELQQAELDAAAEKAGQ